MAFDWQKLKTPFFVLAPMYDVTDSVFRRVIALCGKPDVMFTEFVSVDGLSHPASRDRMIDYYFSFSREERPLIAQIWGNDPEKFRAAATIIKDLGFDGIDINMGCPDKKVVKAGMGGAMIADPVRAVEVIAATKEASGGLPVSVKTRMGTTTDVTETWLEALVGARPAAITLHARLVKDMSRVPADWNAIARAVSIAKPASIPVIGNGDVKSREQGIELAAKTGCSGIMVGRGVLGNYWFFNEDKNIAEISPQEKLAVVAQHATMFDDLYVKKGIKRFHMMRKHLAAYATGFSGARELRSKLMCAEDSSQVRTLISKAVTDGESALY